MGGSGPLFLGEEKQLEQIVKKQRSVGAGSSCLVDWETGGTGGGGGPRKLVFIF